MAETNERNYESRDPKSDLERSLRGNIGSHNLVFPHDLDAADHWVVFRVHKHEFRREADYPIDLNDTGKMPKIFLPMPASLGTQYGHTYNSEGVGYTGANSPGVGTAIAAGAGGGLGKMMDSVVNSIKSVTAQDVSTTTAYYTVQAAEENLGPVAGAAIGGIPGALAGAAVNQSIKGGLAAAGVTRNPYMAVMYDSPHFRTHAFSWRFMPKNKQESKTIYDIIKAFKYHAAPTHSEIFLHYPDQFDIDFHHSEYLFNIGPSVLTSFEVNYHGEGQPLYHAINDKDKAPVSIQINAQFQEVAVLTKKTIEEYQR